MNEDPLLRYLEKRTTRRFVALVRTRREEVLNTAYRILGDRDQAEDVTQEVFLKLLTARWEPEKIRSGRALLAAHTVRTAISRIRSEARRSQRERKAGEADSTEPEALPLESVIDVRDAVLKLPDDLRACVELRYFGGLTLSEVSKALQLGVTTVKERLREARESLRHSLAPLATGTLMTGLLGVLLSDEAGGALPSIMMSGELAEKLDRLARQGPGAAVVAAGGSLLWSAKVLLPLAACGLLFGVASFVIWHRPSDAPAVNTVPVAAAPDATPPVVVATPPLPAPAQELPVDPPVLAVVPDPKPYRVVDGDGQKIEGAEVMLVTSLRGSKPEWAPPEGDIVTMKRQYYWLIGTRTDAAGRFGFSDAAFKLDELGGDIDRTSIVARKAGFYDTWRGLDVRPLEGFSLTLHDAAEATVRVVEEHSMKPVRRYRLELCVSSNEGVMNMLGPLARPVQEVSVDDPEGAFQFMPTDAGWKRQVRATLNDGTQLLGIQFAGLEGQAEHELVLRVSRPQQIVGVVEDSTGAPIAAAEVYACNYREPLEVLAPDFVLDRKERRGAHKVKIAEDGTFAIDPLPGDTWLVALQGKEVPAIYHSPKPAPSEPIHLVLGRGGSVRIERLDSMDAPVQGESETLLLIGLEESPPKDTGSIDTDLPFGASSKGFQSVTNENGIALLERLPQGHYYWKERQRRLEVKAGEVTSITDRDPVPSAAPKPKGGARIHGRVTLDGKPLLKQVFVAHQSVRLDADGRYEIDAIAPGTHVLQGPTNYPGLPQFSKRIRFEVSPADKVLEVSWDFPLCEIRGRAVMSGETDTPPKLSITIWLKYAEDSQPRTVAPFQAAEAHPDAAGAFVYKHLTSGEYFLLVRAKGFEMQVLEFEVSKDSPKVQEFDFRLVPSRASFTVNLVDPQTGSAVATDELSFVRRGTPLQVFPDNYPAASYDHFEWSGLPPGVYDYGVSGKAAEGFGFVWGSIEIKESTGAVARKILVPRAGDLLVAVEDAGGRRLAEPTPTVELRRPDGQPVIVPMLFFLDTDLKVYKAQCESNGQAKFQGLPIGMYSVVVSREGYQSVSESLEVRAGETCRASVVISPR